MHAPEGAGDLHRHRLGLLWIGQVGDEGADLPPRRASDRFSGLTSERIENVDNRDISAARRRKLRDGAADAARASSHDCGASRETKTIDDAHRRTPAASEEVGKGFGSRKRRSTFSVMRDTLLS